MGIFGTKKKEALLNKDVEEGNLPVAVAVMADNTVPPPAYNPSAPVAVSPPPPVSPGASSIYPQKDSTKVKSLAFSFPRCPTVIACCPHCQTTNVTTRIRTAPDWITWIVAIGLLFIFWPICWLPFVSDSMKKTEHYCPSCQMFVGATRPFQDCCVKHRG